MARLSGGTGDAVSVLQHWDAENSDALNLVIEEFRRRNEGVTVDNAAAHISTLRLHVKSQILKEDPPDIWSDWPGKNLEPLVDTGAIADVTDVWQGSDMESAYLDGAKDAARFDGRYRCVPLDIYRINNLYYNVEHVEDAGVDLDGVSSPSAFLDLLADLDSALEVPPLLIAMKDPFGPLQLWETFLVAHGGPTAYEALAAGETTANRETVRAAVESFEAVLSYVPDDAQFLASEEADAAFANGEAALFHNGTWAIGRLQATDGFEFGTEWEHRPFPGTAGMFLMNMNALVPAAQTEGDEAVASFLAHAGSRDGLETFNAEVGAVPPREDVPRTSLHPLTQRLAGDSEDARELPSMTHGLGVAPDQLVGLKEAIASHMADRDVDETTRRFLDVLGDGEG